MSNPTTTDTPPTGRQLEILGFIRDHIARHGYAPGIRDIGKALGIRSPNGVMCHVKALVKKGLLTHDRQTARSFRVVDATPADDLPTVRRVGAGTLRVSVPDRPLTAKEARELAATLLELTS